MKQELISITNHQAVMEYGQIVEMKFHLFLSLPHLGHGEWLISHSGKKKSLLPIGEEDVWAP
jgi:hypothetical protein